VDTEQVWRAIEQQRLDLADFLEALEPAAWDKPSLCEGWRVREVAAHVTLAARARPLQAVVGILRARGSFNRYVRGDAIFRASRYTPQELVAELRRLAGVRHHPPGATPVDPLVDILVHGQDIAVPLGLHRPMPTEAAVAAAERVWTMMSFPFFARRRFRGKRLRATNADWTAGEGEELAAPVETLLLMLTGRKVDHTHS
jgi:uncharacterized protein (TIGR03083 family)